MAATLSGPRAPGKPNGDDDTFKKMAEGLSAQGKPSKPVQSKPPSAGGTFAPVPTQPKPQYTGRRPGRTGNLGRDMANDLERNFANNNSPKGSANKPPEPKSYSGAAFAPPPEPAKPLYSGRTPGRTGNLFQDMANDLERSAAKNFAKPSQNRSIAEREAAPSWDTSNLSQPRSGGGQSGRSPISNMANKRIKQWAIGGIIAAILGVSAGVPTVLSQALAHVKTLASDLVHKNTHNLNAKRQPKLKGKSLFSPPDPGCKGSTNIECRFGKGATDDEIKKFQEKFGEKNIEVAEGKDGKYIKAINTTDIEGKPLRIGLDNFEEHYNNDIKFRGTMDKIAKPMSMLLRGKTTLKLVFDRFGIKRNRAITGNDDRERNRQFRADEYGSGNETEKAIAGPENDKDPNQTKDIEGVNQDIQDAAQQERSRLTSSNFDTPPSIVPDTTNLDLAPDKAIEVGDAALKGGALGFAQGIFNVITKACSASSLIRAGEFGAKIYKLIGLIKYAGILMTLIDKSRAGESTASEIGYIANIMFKPSKKKESLGKTFFQSEGFNLIFQKKVADHRGLARFSLGTPFMNFLQRAKAFLDKIGANKNTCKHVESWYGQGAIIILGLATTITSGGSLSALGIIAGASIGMLVSVAISYLTPLLIQYAAGTIAPDPTDEEGGYAAGNAFGAGMDAFGYETGKANGARTLNRSDAAVVEMESDKEMAFQEKVDNYGKNPFSFDSDTSITTKLALVAAPYLAAPFSQSSLQNVASFLSSPFNLFGSAFGGLVAQGASAQTDIARGGEYCADEDQAAAQLAVTAWCAPLVGEKQAVINEPKYAGKAVDIWMHQNGHVGDDGAPKSEDFKKYIRSCPEGIAPETTDGGGQEGDEDIDTRWCSNPAEKFTYFRMFLNNNSQDSSWGDSIKGTLGEDDSSGTSDTGSAQTYPNGKIPESALCELGDRWPGQKLRCSVAEDFSRLANAYKDHFGKDIVITDSYRSYEQQVQCQQQKGDLCATPGTSNHGCGQAVDFGGGIQNFGSPEYNWMKANAGTYNWIHPAWAEPGGSKPEPWHWEDGTGGNANNGTCAV